jgi:hypothetical protein
MNTILSWAQDLHPITIMLFLLAAMLVIGAPNWLCAVCGIIIGINITKKEVKNEQN